MTLVVKKPVIVVLDDDPTGTQTVHNVPVLTTWEEAAVEEMFRAEVPLFYILTNSRAFSEQEAAAINEEIGEILKKMQENYQRQVLPISRSDSTLRGHFPAEVEALGRGLGYHNPLIFLIPAFLEGGRFTLDGVHYLVQDGVKVPVAETPFARDPVFGYTNSDLTAWVLEKAGNAIRREQIRKVSRAELSGPLVEKIAGEVSEPNCRVVVADAEIYEDLAAVARLIHRVQAGGREVIIRSAASIVKTLGDLEAAPWLRAKNLLNPENRHGGLVIVGSFVPLSTRQVAYLMEHSTLPAYLVTQETVDQAGEEGSRELAQKIEAHIRAGQTPLVYTQRTLQTGSSREETREIGRRYADLLVNLVQQIREVPAFVVAKGGITSSDIATKGLGIKKALVKGQIAAGVSVWEPGEDSRLRGFPYVIFPGNVGTDETLYEVVNKFLKGDEA